MTIAYKTITGFSLFILILTGCEKNSNVKVHPAKVIRTVKFESPIALNMSYNINTSGDYYILAVLVSKENISLGGFEIDVPEQFIKKGQKKWTGELESNKPKLLEIEVVKTYSFTEITGVFTVSIGGQIFTVNSILKLNKNEKSEGSGFVEKKNEKGEKIADFKISK